MLDTLTAQAATTAQDFQEAPAEKMANAREAITIDPDYSIKGLVAAVIIQAVRDAARGDRGAVEWLQWDGLLWCEAAGFDANEIIKKWILEGCKLPKPGSKPHKPAVPRKRRSPPVCLPASTQAGVQPACAVGTADRRTGRARKPRKSRQEAHHAILTA